MFKPLALSVIAGLTLLVACGTDSTSILDTVKGLEAKGDYPAAIVELNRGLLNEPQSGQLRYHLGRMHSLAFDAPAAEHEFRKARELGLVEGGRVALGLGHALLQQRKYREVTTDVLPAPAFEQAALASVHALRGDALLNLDRTEEAKQELHKALRLDATNADVMLSQARFLAGGRDVSRALSVVETLIEREPRNVDAWIHKADLLTSLEKSRESLQSLEKALEIRPLHLRALAKRAVVLVEMGRLGEAQKDVETLRTSFRRHPATAYLRGQLHYWRGEYREALDMAQAALKSDENDGPARLLSGMAHMMLDAPVQAEHELARYTGRYPRDVAAQRLLTDLRFSLKQNAREFRLLGAIHSDGLRKASVQALFGDEYIRVWQHSKVADWFERVAASQPPDPLMAVKQARRRFSSEQLDLAAADLDRVVALNDGSEPTASALVLVHLARSDTTKAMDAIAAMKAKSPADGSRAAALTGVVLLERNQRDEAERRFEEALQLDPKAIWAVVGRARFDVAAGRLDLARRRFDEALRLDPENLKVLVFYAHLEHSARRRDEAMALLERAIKAHPNAVEPRLVLIDLLRKGDVKDRALAVAEDVLKAYPDDPIAIAVVADLFLWLGDADRAVGTLAHLLKLLPRSPESYFMLAKAQFKAGLKADADTNLKRALELPVDESDAPVLPVFGIIDDTRTLESIELARKSSKIQPNAGGRIQADSESWAGEIGGSRFYDALSGAAGRRN